MAGGRDTAEARRKREQAVEEADKAADAERAEAVDELAAAAVPRPARTRAKANGNGTNGNGNRPATITAAAASYRFDDRKAVAALRRRRQAWHDEACDYVHEIGELGYEVEFCANLMSKLRLFPAYLPDPGGEPLPVTDGDAQVSAQERELLVDTLVRLHSPQGGQSALLYGLGWNFEVTGDAYLHGHEVTAEEAAASEGVLMEGEEQWFVRSVRQVVVEGDWFALRTTAGSRLAATIPKDDAVKRLWNPDPEWDELSTSPVRRVLSICENLLLAQRAMRATLMSHLPAGLLLKPEELSFGSANPTRGEAEGEDADDPFEQSLRDTLVSPIQEPGSAGSIAPGVVTGKAEFLKPDVFRLLTFSRPIDQLLVGWIEGLVMRLARGLNMPVEVTTGLQECVDHETQILTADGWKWWHEVLAGDEVLTLDHETGASEWQPVQRVATYHVDGQEMVSLEGKSHSSLTTMNHRWPVLTGRGKRRWAESGALKDHHRIIPAAPCADLPAEPKWSDAFVEVTGWFWTEGCFHGTGGGTLSQSRRANPEKVAVIRDALTRLCGPPRPGLHAASRSQLLCTFDGCDWPVHGVGLCNAHRGQRERGIPLRPVRRSKPRPEVTEGEEAWRETDGANDSARFHLSKPLVDRLRTVMDDDKVVTVEFLRSLTKAQLLLFIDASVSGDGHRSASDTLTLRQANQRRTEAFAVACALVGRSVSWYERTVVSDFSPDGSQQWGVTAGGGSSMRLRNMDQSVERYSGVVWCPQVENGTWFARRHGKGYFTGNTTFSNASQVRKSEWDAHGEPRAILVVDSLTAGYYREALVKGGMAPDRAAEFFIWYDPSQCISAPDPTDSADLGSEHGLITDEAWRRVRGYGDADAPSDDELLRRLAYAAPRMDPFLAAQLWAKTGMFPDVKIPAPPSGILEADGSVTGGPPSTEAIAAAVSERLTAAARPAHRKGAVLGRRLMQIDRDLRLRVQVAAEAALRRALERAGAKVKPKLGRDGPAAQAASSVPARLVCATVGRDVVAAAAGDVDFGGEFDDLADDLGAWVEVAWNQAVAAVQAAYGPIPDARMTELAGRLARNVPVAQEQLKARMVTLAGQRLYDPAPAAPAVGEFAASSSVPAGIAREVLALAGGDVPQPSDGGGLTSGSGDGPVGGVATGPDIMGETGGVEGYVWDYGTAPRIDAHGNSTSFPPHETLHGITVVNFDDPAWANDTGWPSDQCLPGDHDGCQCDLVPVLLDPSESESSD